MKKYQQQRNVSGEKKGTLCPFQPEYAAGDPATGVVVYRWFDTEGKYLGWCDFTTGRKFLYGKLYYQSKGKYQTKTRKSLGSSHAKKIFIYEKGTDNLALYGVSRVITQEDLIDLSDKTALIKVTRDAIKSFQMCAYNFQEYPNKYQVIPLTMRRKFEADIKEFLASKKQELIAYLDDYEKVLTAQRADEVNTGIPIDI